MKLTFIALLLLGSIGVHAQDIFEKGYFIDNAGKRTDCFIKDVRKTPKDVTYKTMVDSDEIKTKTISDVSEFGIDDVTRFKRFTVKMDRSSDNIRMLKKSKVPVFIEETLFLKVLVSGNASLYTYTEENFSRYFYETQTKPIEQLVYLRYIADNGEMGTNNQFRQQLLNDVSSNLTRQKDIKNLKYQREELTKHFLLFNNQSAEKKKVRNLMLENRKAKPLKEFFAIRITPGIDLASLAVEFPQSGFYGTATTQANETVFRIGAEFECLPFRKKKFSFFVNPMYSKFSTDIDYQANKLFYDDPETRNLKVDYSTLEISFGVRYAFYVKKSVRVFTNVAFAGDLTHQTEIENNGVQYGATGSGSNILVGVGCHYKKLSLEARFSTKKDIATAGPVLLTYNAFGLIAGYNFL